MPQHVIAFDGPVGVGKTPLDHAVAQLLGVGFVDGDDHSDPGPWLRSSLRKAAASPPTVSAYPFPALACPPIWTKSPIETVC